MTTSERRKRSLQVTGSDQKPKWAKSMHEEKPTEDLSSMFRSLGSSIQELIREVQQLRSLENSVKD